MCVLKIVIVVILEHTFYNNLDKNAELLNYYLLISSLIWSLHFTFVMIPTRKNYIIDIVFVDNQEQYTRQVTQ